MNKYKIEITENLAKIIEVNANTEEEALEIVKKMYEDEKIVLDYSNFIDNEIQLLSDE